jgi:hypothetical protein
MTSNHVRYEVLRRDNYTCRYCGASAPDTKLEVDHVVPRALGGTDDPTNLVAACIDCNAGKASTPPAAATVADVHQTGWRWQQARRLAVEEWRLEHANQQAAAEAVELFDRTWTAWRSDDGSPVYRPDDWPYTIRHWLHYELTGEDIASFVRRAMTVEYSDKYPYTEDWRWRYLCGSVWRVVREIDDRTAQLAQLGDEPDPDPVVTDERGTFLPGTGWIEE